MAYRSENKYVDEMFSYNSNVNFLTVHQADSLMEMNSELAKIDELLVDAGVEGIYHTNQEGKICYSAEMLGELLAYSSDLAFYALELIDKPLYKNFNLNATESISRIKVEDYSTENTLGITYTAHTSHGDYENCAKKTLSIEDFLGVTAPENGGTLSNIPKEFKDFSNQYVTMYENLKANLVDEDGNQITLEEYLNQLVSMGEFSHTKDQPFRQFLSAVLDITIILPLIEACTGTDYITDEDLSDFERGMKGVGAVVGAFSLGTSYVAMKGAGFATQEILMNMGKALVIDVASTTTSYWTGYACNEMGLPLPLTLMFSMGVGMGTSYGLNKLLLIDKSVKNISRNTPNKEFLQKIDPDLIYDGELKDISDVARKKAFKAGLNDEEITILRKIKQGSKPEPNTYLPEDFIRKTLQKFEEKGCYKIISDYYGEPTGTIGNGGLYVIHGDDYEYIMKKAAGNPRIIEKYLAMEEGYLGENPCILKIDEPENLRIATGNEVNAWQDEWCPAATTRNGMDEAVINPPDRNHYKFRQLIGETDWR